MAGRNTSKLIDKARDAIKKRNYDYAIELYQQALGIDPNDAEARRELRAIEVKKMQETGGGGASAFLKGFVPFMKANFFNMLKKWDECIRECENFLKFDPKNRSILSTLANACQQAGYLNSAILTYEELLEKDRKDVEALKSLGYLYQDNNQWEKATKYFELAKKYAPSDGEAHKALRDIAAKGAETQMQDGLAKGDGSFRGIVRDQDED